MDKRETLRSIRERLRAQAGSPFADAADATFDNDPRDVAAWLRRASALARDREYLIARPWHPAPETIYVEMNRFEMNPDRWMMDAFACGPPRQPGEPIDISPAFDTKVGLLLGDIRLPSLTLTGMEPLQALFAAYHPSGAPAESIALATSLVRLSFFELLERACRATPFPMRVAAAVHDEDEIASWERDE